MSLFFACVRRQGASRVRQDAYWFGAARHPNILHCKHGTTRRKIRLVERPVFERSQTLAFSGWDSDISLQECMRAGQTRARGDMLAR